ncbi:MAG: DUF2259 domain-containing protein [Pseudomonadota bacterium]
MASKTPRTRLSIAMLAVLASASMLQPVAAGDTATLNILGFSADGGIFAFEEYGVQDGSGFPYANRFYIDTASDTFTGGAPFRVRLEDEMATVDDARAQAKSAVEAIITDSILAANRGTTAGFNPVSELSADPFRMVVNPRQVVPPIDTKLEVRLEEKQFAASGSCMGIADTVVGFRLLKIATEPGETTQLLADDQAVPSSRNCPLGYSIGAIQTFFPQGGDPVFATLLAIESFGFEGPDFRWMAVTAPMNP